MISMVFMPKLNNPKSIIRKQIRIATRHYRNWRIYVTIYESYIISITFHKSIIFQNKC